MKKSSFVLLLGLAPFALLAQGNHAPDKSSQRALDAVRKGQFVALEVLIKDALKRVPGEVIDVELDDDEYEIEVLAADGVVWDFEYDARSGKLKDMERDD